MTEELRKLAEAATRGPWRFVRHTSELDGTHTWSDDWTVYADDKSICMEGAHPSLADPEYIAAVSPDVVLGLLDSLDAARSEVAHLQQDCQTEAATVEALRAEIKNLHTVMMAAAVEITEHWDAHCDAEGYGPVNLVRRLENSYPEQYGYDAQTVVRMEKERDTLQARLAEIEKPQAQRLSDAEVERCVQWFNAVQDLNASYLEQKDFSLAKALYEMVGRRVPSSVSAFAKRNGIELGE